MNIETVADTPRPSARVDYDELAIRYNALHVGGALRLEKLSNVTNFKRALNRRGVKEGIDYEAYQRTRHCFIKRLSRKTMTE